MKTRVGPKPCHHRLQRGLRSIDRRDCSNPFSAIVTTKPHVAHGYHRAKFCVQAIRVHLRERSSAEPYGQVAGRWRTSIAVPRVVRRDERSRARWLPASRPPTLRSRRMIPYRPSTDPQGHVSLQTHDVVCRSDWELALLSRRPSDSRSQSGLGAAEPRQSVAVIVCSTERQRILSDSDTD